VQNNGKMGRKGLKAAAILKFIISLHHKSTTRIFTLKLVKIVDE
jgi:hypothetical protein